MKTNFTYTYSIQTNSIYICYMLNKFNKKNWQRRKDDRMFYFFRQVYVFIRTYWKTQMEETHAAPRKNELAWNIYDYGFFLWKGGLAAMEREKETVVDKRACWREEVSTQKGTANIKAKLIYSVCIYSNLVTAQK